MSRLHIYSGIPGTHTSALGKVPVLVSGSSKLTMLPSQVGILAREATRFKSADSSRLSWPTILAGGKESHCPHNSLFITSCFIPDFNFTPLDPAYSLLTTATLSPEHETMLSPSRVVHTSIDPTVSVATPAAAAADGDEAGGAGGSEEQDPDRVITNARPAKPEDGLLDSGSLVSLFSEFPRATSTYALGLSQYLSEARDSQSDGDIPIFGCTHSLPPATPGFYEPAFTSYTHYWKSVLGELTISSMCLPAHLYLQITYSSSPQILRALRSLAF